MDLHALTEDTIAKVQTQLAALKAGGLEKATVDLGVGLTGFNLEAPAKLLVPIVSGVRDRIPRRTVAGIGTNWKAITAVTPSGAFKAADGVRSTGFDITKTDYSTSYGEYGQFGDVTWAGEIAAQNFDDARARAETLALLQFLRREWGVMAGGHTTNLGAGPAPTVVAGTSGGNLADDEYWVYPVPLTLPGVAGASRIARPTGGESNNYDFSTAPTLNLNDGVGLPDAGDVSATITGGSGNGKLTVTWTWDKDAVAYAVYVGLATGSTNAKLQGIVTQSEVVITDFNTTGAAPNTSDTSGNAPFKGMWHQLTAAGSGSYLKRLNGPLSAAVGRGIPEIDEMLDDIYERTKEEPDILMVGYQEHGSIDDKLAAVSQDRIKLNVSVPSQGDLSSEMLPRFTTYKSRRGKVLRLIEDNVLPGGAIMAIKDEVMIPNSQIPNAWQMHMGRDLARLDYAMANPKFEFEVRAYGALAGYAPSFQGMIYDIHAA